MITTTTITLAGALGALAEGLEAMAFVSLAPLVGEAAPMGDDAVQVRLAFAGPLAGEVAIVAPRAFGRLLVSNVESATCHCGDRQAEDAIGEVANVVCGRLLRSVGGGGAFSLGLPRVAPVRADVGWGALTVSAGESIIVDAEGIAVGLRLSLGQPNQ